MFSFSRFPAKTANVARNIRFPTCAYSCHRLMSVVRKSPALYAHPISGSESRVAVSLSPDAHAVSIGTFPQNYINVLKAELKTLENKLSNFEDPPEMVISKPGSFEENPAFAKLLQQMLATHIEECPTMNQLVQGVILVGGSNYFNVYDFRAPPPTGRIPNVEDTLGLISLDTTGMVPGTYQANPMYRPVASSGIVTLPEYLNEKLQIACENK